MTVGKLFLDVLVTHDRSGNELREERNVQKKAEEGFLNLCVFAVNVDDVRHGLEGKETDPDRHRQRNHGNLRPEDRVEGLGKEAEVFIDPENTQIEYDCQNEP